MAAPDQVSAPSWNHRSLGHSTHHPVLGRTLTRKNALFAGSDRGGQTSAVIASLVETCKLNGVDPQAYLSDIISRIVGGHPQSRLDELLLWAHPTIPGLKAAA